MTGIRHKTQATKSALKYERDWTILVKTKNNDVPWFSLPGMGSCGLERSSKVQPASLELAKYGFWVLRKRISVCAAPLNTYDSDSVHLVSRKNWSRNTFNMPVPHLRALGMLRTSSYVCRPVLPQGMSSAGSSASKACRSHRMMCSAASSYVYGNSEEPTGGRKPFSFVPRRVIVVTKSTRFEDEAMWVPFPFCLRSLEKKDLLHPSLQQACEKEWARRSMMHTLVRWMRVPKATNHGGKKWFLRVLVSRYEI
jgi:hypothetical protein